MMRQLILDLPPPLVPRLEDFVIGPNAETVATLADWAQQRTPDPLIYLWGPPASGKTHLLRALAPTDYQRCEPTTQWDESSQPLMVLDDIERLSKSGAESLFYRFNERREAGLRMLVSAAAPPARLALLPDLASRLGWGLTLRLEPLDDDHKRIALERHATRLGLSLPPAAARYILNHWSRHPADLADLLDLLDRHALSAHRSTLTIPLIRDALSQLTTVLSTPT